MITNICIAVGFLSIVFLVAIILIGFFYELEDFVDDKINSLKYRLQKRRR